MTNTFGNITLSNAKDTLTLIDFPVKKGFSTLEVKPEDFLDSIVEDTNTIASQQITKTSTTAIGESDKLVSIDTTKQTRPFTEFNDQVFRINYTKIGDIANGWMFWAFLAVFVIYCITKITFKKQTRQVFTYITNYNFAQKEFEKSWDKTQFATVIFQLLFAFNAGVFVFFAAKTYLKLETSTMQDIAMTIGFSIAILLLYTLKKFLFYVIATIFDRVKYARECVFSVYLYNRAIGTCIFPVVIALAFMSENVLQPKTLLIIGYIIIGIIYILRLYREFQISQKNQVSFIYIFLYFCTLEILPLMVLTKVISSIIVSEFTTL